MGRFFSLWRSSSSGSSGGPGGTVTPADVQEAHEAVRKEVYPSPVTFSPAFSRRCGREVYFKWENKLPSGSFKERGAIAFLSKLEKAARERGVCAASAGNHALALSRHAARLGIRCKICMPLTAPLVKTQTTRANGAEVELIGKNFDETYRYAKQVAEKERLLFVPAFDHPSIIAGQGTVALELLSQLQDFDAVVVPVGGGGLIAGMATVLKEEAHAPKIIGVRSAWAIDQRNRTGGDLPQRNTFTYRSIADGIAVKHPGELTEAIIAAKVDEIASATESEIAAAIITMLEEERAVVEGAGAAGVAALLSGAVPADLRRIVIVVSGSNIDMNLLSRLIERDMAQRGRLLRLCLSVADVPGSLHAVAALIAGCGANVLEVLHDRHFAELPGNVEISFTLELEGPDHRERVLKALASQGIAVRIMEPHSLSGAVS